MTTISGIPRGAFPWWFLHNRPAGKSLLVIPDEIDVLGMVDDCEALFKLPSDWLNVPSFQIAGYTLDEPPARQAALHKWLFGKVDVLVASQEGLQSSCDIPEDLKRKSLKLAPGFTSPRTQFEERLAQAGYSRNEWAEQEGEYAIRGDVIDIWPGAARAPIRITWNFDTIEALRKIDPHSQRSEDYEREVWLTPVAPGEGATLQSILPREINFYSYEPSSAAADIRGNEDDFKSPSSYVGHIDFLREHLVKWQDDGWRVAIFCHNRGERDRLEELLSDRNQALTGGRPDWFPTMLIGELEHGFLDETRRLAILTNSEIFGRYRKRVRLPKFEVGASLSSYLDLKPHDFLVHEKYGIGRYVGLRSLNVGGVTSEYLNIEYKGGDRIYVPIFELEQVQKYLGAEGKRPALSSLDTVAWERVKSKVKEDVAQLAADLLKKAAKRSTRTGTAFPPPSHLEQEFAESFMYQLTQDQQKTLEEVERDMMAPKAMDRLICGDVGFGKTEIAMRAALKCALAAKQVALLCPTTILAEQHARNFSERLVDYPVTVRLISRFQDPSEQKEILSTAAKGGVDIVVGTHRLLSKDVSFKDLGLLIIDEEHRFGVKQKQRLLDLRDTVDVLSLTATPIPRTLASSLGGIKNLSLIETPPEGRLPIVTHVGFFDEDLMIKAVQTELDRGGQVFYVHNRVKTLLARKTWLESVMPSVRIAMAHGQMKEEELEKSMYDFLHKKVDVLLATTIIESGLDIPSVNTLVVEEAEELGLAQLYQLRGRVGRSSVRATCYLFYSNAGMTTDAKKRLSALKEFTSLGSGLKLALRDMEIRGAGNLLGPQQHGNMAAVGVETYSRLLQEEIQKQKGEPTDEETKGPLMELNISAYLPEDYLPSESQRIQMYKRILTASSEELVKLKEELTDRCGSLPEPARLLFDTAGLRLRARAAGIVEIHQEESALLIYFRKDFKLNDKSFQILMTHQTEWHLVPGTPMGLRISCKSNENILDVLGNFLRTLFPALEQ